MNIEELDGHVATMRSYLAMLRQRVEGAPSETEHLLEEACQELEACVKVLTVSEKELDEKLCIAQETLDALSTRIAILDTTGTIIAVNSAWREFAIRNHSSPQDVTQGANYLAVCDSAHGPFSEEAAETAAGIRAVLDGERNEFSLEYPCHSSTERHWYIVRVTRFYHHGSVRLVVTHEEITERKRAEEALREQERFTRQIADLSPVLIDVFDFVSERNPYISRYAVNLHGYTPEEIAQMKDPLSELLHPEDVPRMRERLERLKQMADGEIDEIEYRMRSREGQWRWTVTRNMPFARNEQGEVRQVIGVTFDITERKRAEEALKLAHDELERGIEQRTSELAEANKLLKEQVAKLRQVEVALTASERQFREAQRIAHLGNWERDLSTNLIHASDELRRIFGVNPQEHIYAYETLFNLVHPDDQHLLLEVTKRALKDQKPFNLEYRIIRTDESLRMIHVRGEVISDEFGKPIKVRGIAQDITERKQAEEELRRQTEILQKIFDHIPVMISFWGADGRLNLVNRGWERTLGWSLEEAQEQNPNVLAAFYPDPQYRQSALDAIVAANGEWADFKTRVRDGRVIDTTWAVALLSDGTRVSIGRDITDRKRAEEERNQLTHRLITAQEDERHHISRELHDQMGQYLAALMLGLKALKDNSRSTPHLDSGITQLQEVITEFSQEVRRLALELRPMALDDLGLYAALSNYVEQWSERSGIVVDLHSNGLLDQRFQPHIETTLYRVIQEALNNVLKHARARHVSLVLEYRRGRLLVILEDDGCGFKVEEALNAPSAERRLGLTGMRERIESVGGELDIESSPDAGTTLVARIPVVSV